MKRGSSTQGSVTKTGAAWTKQTQKSHRGPSETNFGKSRAPRDTGQLRQAGRILRGPDKGMG